MKTAVEILAELLGTQAALAERLAVLPTAVSNWKVTGIPDHQKWRIAKLVRAMRDGGEISQAQFLEAIEALEAEAPVTVDQ